MDQPPSITEVADQLTVAGEPTQVIGFEYSDPETPKKNLIFEKESSNDTLIPLENIILVSGNEMRIVPAGNLTGTSVITLTVTDEIGQSSSTKFTVTVLPRSNPVFAASAPITVVDDAVADPYPSSIEVAGVAGTIRQVIVTLGEITHAYPDDISVLLVGPTGQTVVLMSKSGGGNDLVDARVTFDDFAAANLPNNARIESYTSYKPTNNGEEPDFPADAPTGPHGSALAVFNGTDPNGTWSLYVMDEAKPDAGEIRGGWLVSIVTTTPRISAIADQETPENTQLPVEFVVLDADTPIEELVVEATVTENPDLIAELEIQGEGNDKILLITPVTDAFGEASITITANDGNVTATSSFKVTVTPVNQPPVISGLGSNYTTPANTPLPVPFQVTDRETPAEELAVAAFIFTSTLGRVEVTGEGIDRLFTYYPSGNVGTTTAEVIVSDGEFNTTNSMVLTASAEVGPRIVQVDDQTTPEDTRVDVGIVIGNTTSENLVVIGFASNPTVIASVNIEGKEPTVRTARITPVPDATGTSLISIFATDEAGSDVMSFTVEVTGVDDPPVLAPIADQTTLANVPVDILLDVSDTDTPRDELSFGGGSPDATLVSGVDFRDDGTDVIATVNLVQDATGEAPVTIFVADATTTVNQTFTLTVVSGTEPVLSASLEGDTLTIALSGDPNVTYDVEGSPDFETWTKVGSITTDAEGNGSLTFNTNVASYVFFQAVTP